MEEQEVVHSATIVRVEDNPAIVQFSTSKGKSKGRDEEKEKKESEKVVQSDRLPLQGREVLQREYKWPPPIHYTQVKSFLDLANNYGSYAHEDWEKRMICVLVLSST